MKPLTVSVTVPVDTSAVSQPEIVSQRLEMLWVLDQLREHRLTHVRAAQVLGIGLDDLYSLADQHGIPAIDPDIEELRRQLREVLA